MDPQNLLLLIFLRCLYGPLILHLLGVLIRKIHLYLVNMYCHEATSKPKYKSNQRGMLPAIFYLYLLRASTSVAALLLLHKAVRRFFYCNLLHSETASRDAAKKA
jgi:hypothetical protein